MDRAGRLQSARATGWVKSYHGKSLVRGYCRHFGVDPLCAVAELRQLGVQIDPDLEEQLRRSVACEAASRGSRDQKEAEDVEDLWDSDDTFAYIAGYTSWGFPYGVTWEEHEKLSSTMDDQGEPGLAADGEDDVDEG